MAALNSLKLTSVVKPTHMPAVQVRRNKLAKRLWEQIELAKAQQSGTLLTVTKFHTLVDQETGQRKQVESAKRLKQWWFVTDSGKLALSIRYGSRVLELAKGKFAVECASEKELLPTLELIKAAVLAGELDTAIEAASVKCRQGFGK